jgi:hypothetical protein
MKSSTLQNKEAPLGNVYVMTHSFFSDVIRIGCTTEDPHEYVKSLSAKTPGEYSVVFALQCKNPYKIKNKVQEYLNAKKYVEHFYEVPANVAMRLLKRETLVIPTLNTD